MGERGQRLRHGKYLPGCPLLRRRLRMDQPDAEHQRPSGSPRPVRRDRRSRRPCDLRRSCPGLCGSIRTGGAQGTHRESRVCKIAHKTPPGNAVKRDLNLPVLRRSRRGSLWGRCLKTSLRQRFSIQLDQSKKMSALN